MQLIRGPKQFNEKGSVITIGNFDGLHLGHQRLLQTVTEQSHVLSLPSVVLTFEPNPKEFFAPLTPIPRLMRFYDKWHAMLPYALDYLYCLRFNKALAQLSPEAFVKNILIDELKASCVVVGHNFHFGVKRAGNIDTLKSLGKQYGFQVIIVDSVQHKDENISSTRLRQHLSMGDFQSVNVMTDRPYRISGRVTYGNQIGRTLGYPTANLRFGRKTIPIQGIFIVLVHGLSDTPLQGVASSGFRPTFDGKELILEVYIFNFDQEIYGKRIQIEFLRKIRDEIKFDSVSDLIKQMDDDVAFAKAFFCFY